MPSDTDRPQVTQTVSVERAPNGAVRFTAWTDMIGGANIRLDIPLDQALGLLRDLANVAASQVHHSLVAIHTGDCATCGNTRLVATTGPGGRPSNDRCPDCGPDYARATRHPYAMPQLGGGIA